MPDPAGPSATTTEAPEETTANREAAKYRKALRETELDRDALRDQLTASRRALVDQHLQAGLPVDGKTMRPSVAADLFDYGGATVADMFGEDGALDMDKLVAVAAALHATRPGLFQRVLSAAGAAVKAEGGNPGTGPKGTSWATALGALHL